jgi:hypothetical protein
MASAVVTIFAGPAQGIMTGGDGDGVGNAARFSNLAGLTKDGINLYVTSGYKVRKIVLATATVTTLAGPAPGTDIMGDLDCTGNAARFNSPAGITTDGTYLYVTESDISKLRRIEIATGIVTTPAGPVPGSEYLYNDTDANGNAARFKNPYGITTDGTNLFVTEYGNQKIRKIN